MASGGASCSAAPRRESLGTGLAPDPVVATRRDWARLRGVSFATAARYERAGLICRRAGGGIDVQATDRALRLWRAADPARRRALQRRRERTADALEDARLRRAVARADFVERSVADLRAGVVPLALVRQAIDAAAAELAPALAARRGRARHAAEVEVRQTFERALRWARVGGKGT